MLTTLSNWASLCTDISDKLCKSSQKKAWFCKIRLSPKLVTTTCQYICTNMSIISVIFRKSSSQKHHSTQFHHHHPGIHGGQKPVPAARSPDRLEHLPCRLFTHGGSQVFIRVISWSYPGTSSLLYFHQTCFLILTILGKLWTHFLGGFHMKFWDSPLLQINKKHLFNVSLYQHYPFQNPARIHLHHFYTGNCTILKLINSCFDEYSLLKYAVFLLHWWISLSNTQISF